MSNLEVLFRAPPYILNEVVATVDKNQDEKIDGKELMDGMELLAITGMFHRFTQTILTNVDQLI